MLRRIHFYLLLFFSIYFQSGLGNTDPEELKGASIYNNPDSFIHLSLKIYDQRFSNSNSSSIKDDSLLHDILTYSKKNKNQNGISMSLYRLGKSAHIKHKDDGLAARYLFESLRYSELINNKEYISKSYNFLGIIFYTNHKYEDAIKYFDLAMNSNEKGENSFNSVPYYLKGLCYLELKKYDSALFMFNQSLLDLKDNDRINEVNLGIVTTLIATKNFNKSKVLLEQTFNYYKDKDEPVAKATAYSLFSKLCLMENKIDEALVYSLRAYNFSNVANDKNNIRIEIAQLLHDIYLKNGNIKEAYKYLQEVQSLKEASNTSDVSSQIALTYAQYRNDLEKNQLSADIKKQKEEKKIAMIASGVLGSLFLIIGFLSLFVRKERQKSEALIHNILPAKTVQQLKKYGKAIPQKHDAVTVMFCDVKEFTSLASILEPEVLINILDFYFGKFDSILSSYADIEKIKTIGDAYLCVSGLNNTPNHALSMVTAAYDIIEFVNSSHSLVKQKFGHSIEFRIGIHSGSLISGVVGTHKYAYDVWGDTVNIAARMESSSASSKINISQATFDYIQPYFKCEKRGMIEVKNGLKLDMYFILEKVDPA